MLISIINQDIRTLFCINDIIYISHNKLNNYSYLSLKPTGFLVQIPSGSTIEIIGEEFRDSEVATIDRLIEVYIESKRIRLLRG